MDHELIRQSRQISEFMNCFIESCGYLYNCSRNLRTGLSVQAILPDDAHRMHPMWKMQEIKQILHRSKAMH
jgi:hypothetical protein